MFISPSYVARELPASGCTGGTAIPVSGELWAAHVKQDA